MSAYYNEIDPKAAEWLRQLIERGEIAHGYVDERSIIDVQPSDLAGFTQCHFFAGIGVWSHALRNAGWSDNTEVWTASLPCQPFSTAGNQKGKSDERHLLPHFLNLVKECRPNCIFGEQVEAAIRHGWLDDLYAEMESQDYTVGHSVFGAHSVGAPHKRQRLYWVAKGDMADTRCLDAGGEKSGLSGKQSGDAQGVGSNAGDRHSDGSESRSMADTSSQRLQGHGRLEQVDDTKGRQGAERQPGSTDVSNAADTNHGGWGDVDWLLCRDGKWRCAEPDTFPLVNGSPSKLVCSSNLSTQDVAATKEARSMRLKGYGNAIVSQCATAFIESFMDIEK